MTTPPDIAIVEDDENVRELLGFVFRRAGFEARLLGDGRAAVEHVARCEPPAAVVLDLMLPYRDGFEVAAAIRADARWSGVPIVVLSGTSLAGELERGRRLGVSAFVPKPFHPSQLVRRVRRLVDAA